MGRLDVLCLTSTPDSSTFYGLDVAISFDNLPNSYRSSTSVVIYKSNSNPTSPANLTWSVVSRIPSSDLNVYGQGEHTCAVNANGVFTFIFQNYTSAASRTVPSGYRYDPFGLPGSDTLIGTKGSGTWRPFKVDPNYQWVTTAYTTNPNQINQALGYVSTPAGSYLVHCMLGGSTLFIASHDETSNDLTLSKVGTWTLPTPNGASPSVFAIGNDQLYVLLRSSTSFGLLNSYSLSSISNTLPANKTYLSPASSNCGNSLSPRLFTNLKTLYLICDRSPFPELYTINDPDNNITIGAPDILNNGVAIPAGQRFATVGGGPGQGRFLLYRTDGGKFAVPLDGPDHATVNIGNITVDDTSGSGLVYPTSGADPSYTAEVVGSISALVVVGFLAAFFYRRRRRLLSTLKGLQTEAGTAPGTPADTDKKSTAPAGSNAQQQQQQQVEMSTPPGGSHLTPATMSLPSTSTPTTILPMAPISSTSNHQSVQDHMQTLQFSQHPRPTVENIRPINDTTVASSSAWQPTPFVPPAATQRTRAPEVTSSDPTPTNASSPPPPIPHGSKPGCFTALEEPQTPSVFHFNQPRLPVMDSYTAIIITVVFGALIIIGGLAFYLYKQEQNKSQAPITPDHPAFKNQGFNTNIVTHTQQLGHNSGPKEENQRPTAQQLHIQELKEHIKRSGSLLRLFRLGRIKGSVHLSKTVQRRHCHALKHHYRPFPAVQEPRLY
ncbi:hypothetical protein BGX30_014408 [Mortierella sp. GBA39]|nr:hypothetical protein BGX30_014408 [Mortierella sp. GBA39]